MFPFIIDYKYNFQLIFNAYNAYGILMQLIKIFEYWILTCIKMPYIILNDKKLAIYSCNSSYSSTLIIQIIRLLDYVSTLLFYHIPYSFLSYFYSFIIILNVTILRNFLYNGITATYFVV